VMRGGGGGVMGAGGGVMGGGGVVGGGAAGFLGDRPTPVVGAGASGLACGTGGSMGETPMAEKQEDTVRREFGPAGGPPHYASDAPRLRALIPQQAASTIVSANERLLNLTGCGVAIAPLEVGDGTEVIALLSGAGRAQLYALHEVAMAVLQTMSQLGLRVPPLKFLIPADAMPSVFGPSGAGVQEISTAAGAAVTVGPQALGGPGLSANVQNTRIVSVVGPLQCALTAARMVLERIYGR